MKENRYISEVERYNIHLEFKQMLLCYRDYLHIPMDFLINENIELDTTDIGVLTLFVKENNKKDITTFKYKYIK